MLDQCQGGQARIHTQEFMQCFNFGQQQPKIADHYSFSMWASFVCLISTNTKSKTFQHLFIMVKTIDNYLFALGEIQNDLRRVLCLFVIYINVCN